ncbi:MAG: hypothetical protein VCE91_15135, partial [Nitrospinota bacterium]
LDIAAQLEEDLGVPVVTANQAAFWAALRRLGLRDKVVGFGRLLEIENLPPKSGTNRKKQSTAGAQLIG